MGNTAIEHTTYLKVQFPPEYPVIEEKVLEKKTGPTTTTLDGHRYTSTPAKEESTPTKVIDVVDKEGWRFLKLGETVGNVVTEVARLEGREVSAGVTNVTKRFGDTWHTLGIITAVTLTIGAVKDVMSVMGKGTENLPDEWRKQKMLGALQKVIGAVSMIFFALSTFFGLLPGNKGLVESCKNLGDGTDGVENFFGVRNSIRSVAYAQDLAKKVEKHADLHENAVSTARLNMLRAVKQICSIVGFAFAMLALFTGASLVAPLYSYAISIISTIVALSAAFYEKSMKFDELKFYDIKCHNLAQRA